MRAWEKILLGALLLAALFLRSCGISHDLHEGRRYHPDSPKQVRAVQMFLEGQYYKHYGHKDYDGYPLFHARIVELFIRVAEPVRAGFLTMLGIPPTPDLLGQEPQIYVLFLLMNVLMSAAIVLIVFHAGRESIGPPAGWIAALLMTVSPADVTCAHLATGDAPTAFFAALALFYTLRIYRLGRISDYVLATLFATFAFAAKYYAATAFFVLAFAHIARCGFTKPTTWFNADAWKRISLCAVVAVAALFFAIPGLFQNFTGSIADIWGAMVNSTQRYPPDIEHAGKLVRYKFSMRVNLPDLLRCISPLAVLAIVLAPLARTRDARVWLLLIGPGLYVFLAVGSRGLVNPIYHTAITPPLFLLIALLAVTAFQIRGVLRLPARGLTIVLIGLAAVVFAADVRRELFFFTRMDTRRLAEEWVRENIPSTFRNHNGRYTFDDERDHHAAMRPRGEYAVRSELDPAPGPVIPAFKLFELEDHPLTQFRNITQTLTLSAPELLRGDFAGTCLPILPTRSGNTFIFDGSPVFLCSEKVFVVDRFEVLHRWLVTTNPLSEAWIGVQAIAPNCRVHVTFNGELRKIRAGDASTALLHIEMPEPAFPSTGRRFFYPLVIEAEHPLVKVTLATTPAEIRRLKETMGHKVDGSQIAIATNAAQFFQLHGIHPDYLDALPALEISASECGASGFLRANAPYVRGIQNSVEEWRPTHNRKARRENFFGVWTVPLLLDPFTYRGKFFVRSLSGASPVTTARLVIRDVHGKDLNESPLEIPALDRRAYTELPFRFEMPGGLTGCSVMLKFDSIPDLAVGGLEIRPDYFPPAPPR